MGRTMRLAAAAVAAVIGSAALPAASFAADLAAGQPAAAQPPATPAEKGHWGFKVGAIGLMEPKYEGSDEYRFLAFPIVIPEYYGENYNPKERPRFTFRGLDDIRYALLRVGNLDIGPLGGYTFGRDDSDASRLRGLGDVNGGIVLGGFAAYYFQPFYVDAAIGTQVTGGNANGSYTVTTGVGANFPVTDRLTLSPYLSATYASKEYMHNYFSVTPAQSAASAAGLPAFDAGAGFKNVAFQLGADYRLTKRWDLSGSATYSRLINDAADSPVTVDANQFSTMLQLTYTFGRTE